MGVRGSSGSRKQGMQGLGEEDTRDMECRGVLVQDEGCRGVPGLPKPRESKGIQGGPRAPKAPPRGEQELGQERCGREKGVTAAWGDMGESHALRGEDTTPGDPPSPPPAGGGRAPAQEDEAQHEAPGPHQHLGGRPAAAPGGGRIRETAAAAGKGPGRSGMDWDRMGHRDTPGPEPGPEPTGTRTG